MEDHELAVLQCHTLTVTARVVWLDLVARVYAMGQCPVEVSQSEIAASLGISVRATAIALRQLEAAGLLLIERQWRQSLYDPCFCFEEAA